MDGYFDFDYHIDQCKKRKFEDTMTSSLGFLTRVTRWVPLVEEELFTLPEHLS
jgi:hypothetical protein